MYEYRISREEKEKWCSIPLDQIEDHPDSKIKLILRDTRPQAELEEESARQANARGVYAMLSEVDLTGKRVVLVDDVVTSGATLSECAAVLCMGGAKQVLCLTLAQARGDR